MTNSDLATIIEQAELVMLILPGGKKAALGSDLQEAIVVALKDQ